MTGAARQLCLGLALALCGTACLGGGTDGNTEGVPTFMVTESPFSRTVRAEGLLKPVKTTLLVAPASALEVLTISWMAEDGTPVKKGDVVVRFDPTDASRWLQVGKADRDAADRRIDKERATSDSSLNQRQRQAVVSREELANAKQLGKKDPRYFPRSEVIESEIDVGMYNQRIEHAHAAQAVEVKLAASKIDLLEVDRERADYQTRKARSALGGLALRAPHDGTFLLERSAGNNRRSGMLKVGERAFPGMRVGEIATSEKMTAEVYIIEGDAGGVAPGKSAIVVLEARPDITMKAHVVKVDPFPKAIEVDVPAHYFATTLDIDAATAGLKPGQRLHATLVLEEQAKALVVPRQTVFKDDDQTFVYRRRSAGEGFDQVRVKLGPGTVGRIVVAEGLRPGDQVALRDPRVSLDDTASGGRPGAASAGVGAPGRPSAVQ